MVILNVLNGGHWVLATKMVDDSTIGVNDPLYDRNSYRVEEVVANNSVLYKVPSGYIERMVEEI